VPEFQYQGVDKEGKKITGKLEAPSEGELRMMLRGQGVRPTRIAPVSILNADIGTMLSGGMKIDQKELVIFTRQLYVLISSGVPLVQSLEVLEGQLDNPFLKNILSAIREKVSQGTFLWQSFAAYPKVFPKLYVALIKAGESSGSLDIMLKRLSRYLEDAERLKRLVKSAMIYPFAIMGVGTVVLGILLTFVIPRFEKILTAGGKELPYLTQVVIDISNIFKHNAQYITVGVIFLAFIVFKYVKTDEGRAFVHRAFFNFPILGPIMQKSGIARFSRTMSTLLSSGVTLIDAIDICRVTIDNAVIEASVKNIRKEVEEGKTLGLVVSKITVFPKMAVQMIMVGESTGNLDDMLERIADFYEEEVEVLVGGISKLIEPVILVVLGVLVGGVMIAMYLPIFKMAGGA